MAKTNFYLRDAKALQPTPILLYVSFLGERVKLPTNETIIPEFWNEQDQRPRQTKKFPTHPEFRTRLDKLEGLVNDLIRTYQNDHDQQNPTPKVLRELWNEFVLKTETKESEPKILTVVEYMERFVSDAKKRTNERTGKPLSDATIIVYNQILNKVKDFVATNKNYRNLDFEGIDAGFYTDFTDFLTKKKLLSINTVGKTIRTFKVFLNNATEEGVNTNLYFKRKNFKAVQENTSSIYLNEEELRILQGFDFSAQPALDRARDLFLVGCWTGLRFSDFSQIRPENITEDETGKYIKLKTQKTDELVEIPLHDTVLSIMEKYNGKYANNLPPSLTNQPLNRYLKEIGRLVGFEGLETIIYTKGGKRITQQLPKYELVTTHTARRSFATNQYLLGVPTITIMEMTGHRTEKSFMKYIKVSKREHAQKIREIWNRQREQPRLFLKVV
jgi:integrase